MRSQMQRVCVCVVCVYVCVCACVCVCVCVCVCALSDATRVCVCVCMCVCMCVRVHDAISDATRVCMCVYACVYVCVHVYACAAWMSFITPASGQSRLMNLNLAHPSTVLARSVNCKVTAKWICAIMMFRLSCMCICMIHILLYV